MFAGANGSSAGVAAATEAPDAAAGVDADAAGVDATTEFIGLLEGADTIEAVVDAHLIIFARAVALFACRTSSLFPANSTNTLSSASCPMEIAILTAFRNHGNFFSFSMLFL